jgi:hypothetical protein
MESRFGVCLEGEYADNDTIQINEKKYAYIDVGNDGVQELAVTLSGNVNENESGDLTVLIKYREDGLHLTYAGNSLYRTGTRIDGQGVVSYAGSGGAATAYYESGVLDADGVYHNVYTAQYQGDPVYVVPEEGFKTASDTMKSEFGDDYYPGVEINIYEIDGTKYYVASDADGYAGTDQNTRYHELLETTTGVTFISEDELSDIVSDVQARYLPNGLSGDTDINWSAY